MRPEIAKFLRDMVDAAEAIEELTHGRSQDEFLNSRPMRDASHWNFCVIGEALTRLRRADEATASRITDYTKIVGLRNQLIHGYDHISDRITWSIIREKLPTLMMELKRLLGE